LTQSHPQEPDPLLDFSEERRPAIEPLSEAPAAQPVDPPVDSQPPAPQPDRVAALAARVTQLERSLSDSRTQVASLRSEVKTLVRAMADMRRPMGRALPSAPAPVRTRARLIAAVAAVGLGLLSAVAGWIHFSSGSDTAAALSIAASPRTEAPQAPEALQAPKAPEAPEAPEAPQAPKAPVAPQAPQAPVYVGTLSIDSSPGGTVFVNRRSAGKTPLRLSELRAGSHLIWIERDGYRRWTRVVHVPADRVSRVSAELEPLADR
jgi:hypothetical protein